MGKRKTSREDDPPSNGQMNIDGGESGSEDDIDMLNVDFEWFDPQPAVDFHGLKTLLRQLFDVDNQLFDLSELADMILAQPLLGSTVKCDGNESDPYAFLTVLNLHQHREKAVVKQLSEYLLRVTKPQEKLHAMLQKLLSPDSSSAQLGLILTERFINMPHQTIPPMYTMLLEEIQWALEEKEPYNFTHHLIISKTYTEVASKLDAEDDQPPSKKKKAGSSVASETFFFHPEDEVLHKHAEIHAPFDYEKQADEGASDSKRAFSELGVRPQGHLILLEGGKFEAAVKAIAEYLGSG